MAELFLVPDAPDENLSDAAAREQALDTTQSWIVEAPAGSGKTGLILQRFLKLLAAVDDPAQVLAITFTRKATAELHDRVLLQLRNATTGTSPKDDYERITRPLAEAVLARGFDLLDHPHRLNVRTIDSLAMDIAAGLPVLSGSGGAKSPDLDAKPLYAEAARRTLMQLGGANQQLNRALETILLHRDGNLANCQDLIALMLEVRDQWGELIPLDAALDDALLDEVVLPKFERALDLAICQGLGALVDALPSDILEQLAALGANIGHSPHCTGLSPQLESADLEHWVALIDLLLTGGGTYRKAINAKNLGVDVLDDRHKAELTRIIKRISHDESLCQTLAEVRELPPARYPTDQWLVTKALFHVLNRALAELQLVFSARGSCDFTEVALLARFALRADSALDDLRSSFGMELQHLLVDEMQDTSSGQYELIQLLTQRWDGRSQTVFLVGDPKQSIYLFRQARVERFVQTMQNGLLGDLELGTLHLTANFRSQRNLVDAFNADFSRIFPLHPDPLQPELVPYRPATAVRQPSTRGTTWHTTVQPYSSVTEETATMRRLQRRITAGQIRPILQDWLNRPLPVGRTELWKIAILVRNRIHLAEIVPALKQAHIPYRAVDIEPLAERQEILDLIALTRALLHPADRTAWLALLRTPWCGLGLRDLHLLAGQDDPAFKEKTILELINDRGDLLSDDGIGRLQTFWPVISAALTQRGRQPLAQWVHQTWLVFRTNLYAEAEILSNVERFFRLLDELEEPGGGLSLPRLQQRLTRLYATATVHPGAVDLMTIHGAKGLEWDFVLVPGLERIGMNTNGRLLDYIELDFLAEERVDADGSIDVAHGIVAPIRPKGVTIGKLNKWMRSLDAARSAAETRRLYYVVCTRAREELHLFAAVEESSKGELKPKSGSLLAAAWPAAQQHFVAFQPANNLLQMASRSAGIVESLAASTSPRIVERIPAPPFALTAPPSHAESAELTPPFTRPQGSFAARAFGNATHAFLEQLATRIAAGTRIETLKEELPDWSPRITAVLRSSGLAPHEVQRFTSTILRALVATLNDPTGLWILAPHPQSASESALISWNPEAERDDRTSVRLDRTFLAGPAPLTTGDTHLWIIDYKTATHGPEGLDQFLAGQQAQYRPQLDTYARQFSTHPIRLALFYPLLQRLLWWPVE